MANCRGCGTVLDTNDVFVDLGALPLVNSLLSEEDLSQPETHYPLRALVCRECLLVQLPDIVDSRQIFSDSYPFYSGASGTWIGLCKSFADAAIERFGLGTTSRVLELGSNDGSLLRSFRGRGVPALGIEPCAEVAQHALMEGLPTIVDWWGIECAERLLKTRGIPTGKNWRANLVVANNVLAHVPDLNDFLRGVRMVLAPGGVVSFEVPYIKETIAGRQWDQVYHEHYCYFSLISLDRALRKAGLVPFDVDYLPAHGGSVRVYAGASPIDNSATWTEALKAEDEAGLHDVDAYLNFASRPAVNKRAVWEKLTSFVGQRMVGYGASAKAAVFCNYCGIGPETLDCIIDITPAKWTKYQPGTRIPIRAPQYIEKPDTVVNFAWNWREESEANIRRDFPDARIVYLHEPQRAFKKWQTATKVVA